MNSVKYEQRMISHLRDNAQTPSKSQRAFGTVDLRVADGDLKRFYQSGSAKIFLPKTYADTIEAAMVNTAGGLTDGDDYRYEITASGNTHLTATTQTAERIYRARQTSDDVAITPATVQINLTATGGASLHWLPQETILFDGSHLRRNLNVKLDGNASVLLAEMLVFGRTAMPERLNEGYLSDQWRVYRDDVLIHGEAVHLAGNIAEKMEAMATAATHINITTILYIAPDAQDKLASAQRFFDSCPDIISGLSAWGGKLVIRLIGSDTMRLKSVTADFLTTFRNLPNPRVWML